MVDRVNRLACTALLSPGAMRNLSLLMAALALAACGGPGSFDGTVAGNTLDVKEAVFFVQPFTFGTTSVGNAIALGLSGQTGTCDSLKANTTKANGTALTMALGVMQGGLSVSDDLTSGSYRLLTILDGLNPPAAGTRVYYSAFDKLDATCKDTTSQTGLATGGSITVDGYTAGKSVTGSFDLQFGSDTGKGSFNATFCDYQLPTTTPACQ